MHQYTRLSLIDIKKSLLFTEAYIWNLLKKSFTVYITIIPFRPLLNCDIFKWFKITLKFDGSEQNWAFHIFTKSHELIATILFQTFMSKKELLFHKFHWMDTIIHTFIDYENKSHQFSWKSPSDALLGSGFSIDTFIPEKRNICKELLW